MNPKRPIVVPVRLSRAEHQVLKWIASQTGLPASVLFRTWLREHGAKLFGPNCVQHAQDQLDTAGYA